MTKEIKLSQRLRTIATFISSDATFADIGSDHGYLSSFVCMNNPHVKASAGEVRKGPYLRTLQTIEEHELKKRIDVRLGDGLKVISLEDKVNEIVIAGMGGNLIAEILGSGRDKLHSVHRLIIQPNNQAKSVRKLLLQLQYSLVEEVILAENEHIYEILVADKYSDFNAYDPKLNMEKQLLFGPLLLKEKNSVFLTKWQSEKDKLVNVIQQMQTATKVNQEKIALYREQLHWIEEALS